MLRLGLPRPATPAPSSPRHRRRPVCKRPQQRWARPRTSLHRQRSLRKRPQSRRENRSHVNLKCRGRHLYAPSAPCPPSLKEVSAHRRGNSCSPTQSPTHSRHDKRSHVNLYAPSTPCAPSRKEVSALRRGNPCIHSDTLHLRRKRPQQRWAKPRTPPNRQRSHPIRPQ